MLAELTTAVLLGLDGLQLVERELLLFAGFWFVIGAADELAVDLLWLVLRLRGRVREYRLSEGADAAPLSGPLAAFVPAWHEADVIGAMVRHALQAWQQRDVTLYVGCYRNDPATIAAVIEGAGGDPRVRLVIHDRPGPTTKADCLNRLYQALSDDELRLYRRYGSVLLHDAEDMVHAAELAVVDAALAHVDFVQLPVRPEPQPGSPLVAGHYTDEFAEAHAKAMVVRDALGAAIPAAGVGCGFSRAFLADLARERGGSGPFSEECLTEDYELGLLVARRGGRSRFLRLRDADGALVATRAYFPATLEAAIRQKSRWVHGISLQGWERLGWTGRAVDLWMTLRDRQGPLTATVLAAAYLLVFVKVVLACAQIAGWQGALPLSPQLRMLLSATFAAFVWRAIWRFGFTSREYGLAEGALAMLRIPVGNVIAILATGRALAAYARTLKGGMVIWEKTSHCHHPAITHRLATALPEHPA